MSRFSREDAWPLGRLSSFEGLAATMPLPVEFDRFELVSRFGLVSGALVCDRQRLKNRAL